MRPRLLAVAFLVVTLATARDSAADTYQWNFTGFVSTWSGSVPVELQGLMPIGTVVRFTLSFDSAAPDQCDQSGRGFYTLPGGSIQTGSTSAASVQGFLEANNPAGNCSGSSSAPTTDYTARLFDFGPSAPFSGAAVGWNGPDPADQVPTTPSANGSYFLVARPGCPTCYVVSGEITEAELVPVPEPATLTLMGIGIAGLIVAHRRRRSR